MFGVHVTRRAVARLGALVAAVACLATVAAPAASALNPQPLPPLQTHTATTPLIGGLLTCHEYGCY